MYGEGLMARSKLEESLSKYLNEKLEVRAGIFETATYPDGTPVASVAVENEYGTDLIPARSFFRTTIAEKQKDWADSVAKGLQYYKGDIRTALEATGERMADDLQESVLNWKEPPNAPYTIAKKGFNKPLVDTGQMSDSFGSEVIDD